MSGVGASIGIMVCIVVGARLGDSGVRHGVCSVWFVCVCVCMCVGALVGAIVGFRPGVIAGGRIGVVVGVPIGVSAGIVVVG